MTEMGEKYKIIMEKIASLKPEDIVNNPEKLELLDDIERSVSNLETLYGIKNDQR
jgi:hypothetical protein